MICSRPSGIDQRVRHVLSAQVHVRHHLHQLDVGHELALGRRALVVGVVGRNGEGRPAPDIAVRHPALLGGRLGDGEADERPVDDFLAARRVVHLERDVGVRRNQLGRAERTIVVGLHARARSSRSRPGRGARPPPGHSDRGPCRADDGPAAVGACVDRHALVVARRLPPVPLVVLHVRPMRDEREADVMRHRQIARLDLERRDPRVLR